MPDFSPAPRHRRDGHPVLALTGVIGVTAVAGLGVVLAVLPARDPAPSAARSVAAGMSTAATSARPAPGFPSAGPFFPSATASREPASERPETEPERVPERGEETEEAATRDGAENNPGNGLEKGQPARKQPVQEQRATRHGAPPPDHEIEASRSSRRPDRTAAPSSRSRPPSAVSSSRSGGSDSTGAAGRIGTGEAQRPRTADAAAAETTAAENTKGTGASGTAVPRGGADAAGPTQMQDPCLRFDDDLQRAYCYEVLRALGQ
ncbi:hypothetical protein SAMN05421833_11735 [Microbispora rosea]|uniref:Uncharacterized protein n=1 Tax=Microbispora rosea TaxID=58117 RepID=A0A1N7EAA1_9ACTN|nr:hypothetical protein Mro03_25540 [Microbispora rosea subsp. rosea]SIR84966.1 hypothetical protein SAMN05421833_11735 [Microbispora rosea]